MGCSYVLLRVYSKECARKVDPYGGARFGPAFDVNFATQHAGALAHPEETKGFLLLQILGFDALAIIMNTKEQVVGAFFQGDFDLCRFRMTSDISEHFLENAKEGGRVFG